MKIIRASFEIVTPAFIAGADQTKAELRIPSLRGVLRFWWRALVYARYQGDLAKIREREAWLFGSTERQSGVIMSFEGEPRVRIAKKVTAPKNDDKSRARRAQGSYGSPKASNPDDWQLYLRYGLIESTEKNEREFIEPGSSFTIRILLGHHLAADDAAELLDALKVFGLVGGIGGRNRKAWGSIRATRIEAADSPAWTAPTARETYLSELRSLIRESVNWRTPPTYSAVWSGTRVAVGARLAHPEAAHRRLVEQYKDYLDIKSEAEDWIDRVDREAFGLPRTTNPPIQNGGARRASTVFLHVHSLGDVGALPVAIFLPAVFLPGVQDEPTTGWDAAHGFLDRIEANA